MKWHTIRVFDWKAHRAVILVSPNGSYVAEFDEYDEDAVRALNIVVGLLNEHSKPQEISSAVGTSK